MGDEAHDGVDPGTLGNGVFAAAVPGIDAFDKLAEPLGRHPFPGIFVNRLGNVLPVETLATGALPILMVGPKSVPDSFVLPV